MDYKEFEQNVKAVGGKPGLLYKVSYFAISGLVSDGEQIKAAGECIDSKGTGVIIVTDKTFYASKATGMFSMDKVTIPLEKITSVSLSGGIIPSLSISEGTLAHTYPQVSNLDGIIAAIKAGQSQPSVASGPLVDTAAELRKFKALLDDGIITQDDFDKKKAALLGI
jgi:hypothetical protein